MIVLFKLLAKYVANLILICLQKNFRQAYDKKQNLEANKRSCIWFVKRLLLKIIPSLKIFQVDD
ncbi:MAG: hypothetical protein PG978_001127 [Wolbachia endosymbiont of Ctenocephalides felis wCfeF]|nr:MAG: hypothetical protein PG978_001127 [Wolbachia endosymbiont of Ctenocephalides felis wCfeF]